jgi:signal transduction histidine kinase
MHRSKQFQLKLPNVLTALIWCLGAGLGLITLLLFPVVWTPSARPVYLFQLEAFLYIGAAVILGIILLYGRRELPWAYILATGVLLIGNVWDSMLWAFTPDSMLLYVPRYLFGVLGPALLIPLRLLPRRQVPRLLQVIETFAVMSFIDVAMRLVVPLLVTQWTFNPEAQLVQWRWLTTISLCYWYCKMYRQFSNIHGYAAVFAVLGAVGLVLGDSILLIVAISYHAPDAFAQGMMFAAPFWITHQLCWALSIYGISQTPLIWSNEPRYQYKLRDQFMWIVPIQRGLVLIGIALGFVLGTIPFRNRAFFIAILALYEILNAYEREQLQQADRITSRKLEEANQQLTAYAQQAVELGTMRERERISRDIHDSTGSTFSRITYIARVGISHLGTNEAEVRNTLLQVIQEADAGIDDVRRAVRNLPDANILQRSLPELIQDEVEKAKLTGLDARLEPTGDPYVLPPHVTSQLWRIVQESFTNVRRHAQATAVIVYLDYRSHKALTVTIEDDGQGCELLTMPAGFGIRSMRERAKQIGGELSIWSRPGHGLQIHVEVPL